MSQTAPETVETLWEGPPTAVHTAACDAMDTALLRIECGFVRGFAGMQVIGNALDVSRDGKERVRAALESLGLHLPARRLVVSLTPADVKKDGSQLDLPVAVSLALLLAEGREPRVRPERWLFAAELGLGGELRPVRGVVSFALAALAAGLDGLVIASDNLSEVSVLAAVDGGRTKRMQVLGFESLKAVLAWLYEGDLEGAQTLKEPDFQRRETAEGPDFDDMILEPSLERAALVVAAGMHSILLRGAPGTGKSMFSARLASLLPRLGSQEHVEAMRIYSVATERLPAGLLAGRPPFRAPHHQASAAAILGTPENPGEIALAHGGILFLDELPEFRRDLLESLREPLETGEVRVSRSRRKVLWRARSILIAACNNCPCGWFGSARKTCSCVYARLVAYRQRLSGPILDRIDVHLNMPETSEATADLFLKLHDPARSEGRTRRLADAVAAARAYAAGRNEAVGARYNRDLTAEHLVTVSGLAPARFATLVNETFPKTASRRSVIRSLRVARTLADLDGEPAIRREDLGLSWSWTAEGAAQGRGEAIVT